VNIVDLIDDTGRCLTGLSPADEIRITTQDVTCRLITRKDYKSLVNKSCVAMSKRLDYLVDKAVTETREAMKK
jgi:hypothetical protein